MKQGMVKQLLAGIILVCVWGCNGGNGDFRNNGVMLRFKPQKGLRNMTYELCVVKGSTGDETTFTIDLANDVTASNTDDIRMVTTYKAITMTGNFDGRQVVLHAGDTNVNSQPALLAAPVFAYKGKQVKFTFDSRFNKLSEKILNPGKDFEETESKVQFIGHYPFEAVKEGDTWESSLDIKVVNKKIEKAMFTVTKITSSEVHLSTEGALLGKGEKFGHQFTLEGEFTGEIIIDIETGWQKKVLLNMDFVLNASGNETPMKQMIKYEIK